MRDSRPNLERISRDRLPDRVALELKRLVATGTYPPGARLPAIRELAEQLGVTAPTVREALVQLETAGLIQSRQGSGTYVLDPLETGSLASLAETLAAGKALTAQEIDDLLAFRTIMITGFVDAIANQARPEHLEQLAAIVAEERTKLGRPEELAALDYRFNEILAVASGNLFYTLLLRSLRQAHLHLGTLVFRSAGDGGVVVDTHDAIVRALHKRESAALRRRIQTYLTGGQRIVAASIRNNP
jgi:GntR family transcriptional repressor for pyruvate dehydrogenase complex